MTIHDHDMEEKKSMYRRILLPLNGSGQAEQALSHAIAQAKQFGAELVVLKVLPPQPIVNGVDSAARQWARNYTDSLAREHLDAIAANVKRQGVAVQVSTIEADSPAKIAASAEENMVDLIVLPTRRPSGLGLWFGSSAADRVARETDIPVLLVRDGDRAQESA
jgi:nucleotide-binding universal stress UspA family protein